MSGRATLRVTPLYPHKNAGGAYLKPRCSLCVVTFVGLVAQLGEIIPGARFENPILIQFLTTPLVNRILQHSRVEPPNPERLASKAVRNDFTEKGFQFKTFLEKEFTTQDDRY